MRKWTDPIKMNISNPSAPGENGNAFIPAKDEVEIMEQLKEQYNFNAYASDKMSLHRSLPDYRFAECQSLTYPEKLPTTSVILFPIKLLITNKSYLLFIGYNCCS